MFLNKQKGSTPETSRSDLSNIAATHGSAGQKMLALLVAGVTLIAILGGVTYQFVMPAISKKDQVAEAPPKRIELKPAAELRVPLDLEGPRVAPAPAFQERRDPDYEPMPGLAGDARPSPAPIERAGAGRQVGAPRANTSASLPPGMEGQGEAAQVRSVATRDGQQPSGVPDRKLSGDLGDSGDVPGRAQPAAPALSRNDSCAGIYGGPEAEAECNRRMGQQRASSPAPGVPMPAAGPAPASMPANGSALSNQLVGIQTPNGSVGTVPNPHLTLSKGEPVTCTLTTAIRTEQAGFVECVTDFPIYSMDGKVVLAERGTRINGEYSRDASPGSNTIFVLWTRAVTPAPHFVTFDLFSPGSDRLGRSGIDGEVDNKYWERYSGPLMFSLLQDVSAVATAKASRSSSGSGVFVLPSTQNTGQNAVAELLKQGSEVKRSIYRNQGDTISITVARYIDFSPVYKLRTVKGRG